MAEPSYAEHVRNLADQLIDLLGGMKNIPPEIIKLWEIYHLAIEEAIKGLDVVELQQISTTAPPESITELLRFCPTSSDEREIFYAAATIAAAMHAAKLASIQPTPEPVELTTAAPTEMKRPRLVTLIRDGRLVFEPVPGDPFAPAASPTAAADARSQPVGPRAHDPKIGKVEPQGNFFTVIFNDSLTRTDKEYALLDSLFSFLRYLAVICIGSANVAAFGLMSVLAMSRLRLGLSDQAGILVGAGLMLVVGGFNLYGWYHYWPSISLWVKTDRERSLNR